MSAGYHLTPFDVGQIKAHAHHGLGPAAIAKILSKPDGKSRWSDRAIADALANLKEDPSGRGERQEGSGRRPCPARGVWPKSVSGRRSMSGQKDLSWTASVV